MEVAARVVVAGPAVQGAGTRRGVRAPGAHLVRTEARTTAGKSFEHEHTANTIASPGRGILAMDESNGTCGKRLEAIGVENNEQNRRRYRELFVTAPMGDYVSGATLFEETLYHKDKNGKPFVDCLKENGVMPGIKVDKALGPLPGSNEESCTQGPDGLASL